jgi:hypothetical protein
LTTWIFKMDQSIQRSPEFKPHISELSKWHIADKQGIWNRLLLELFAHRDYSTLSAHMAEKLTVYASVDKLYKVLPLLHWIDPLPFALEKVFHPRVAFPARVSIHCNDASS